MNDKMVRAEIRIKGRVQGVNFRYFTLQNAKRHDVTGWVKNLPDGDVKAVFEGSESDVLEVIDRCRKGPQSARVDDVLIDREDYQGEFSSFDVLP